MHWKSCATIYLEAVSYQIRQRYLPSPLGALGTLSAFAQVTTTVQNTLGSDTARRPKPAKPASCIQASIETSFKNVVV